MDKKVLFILIGNIRYDGRVKKEIESLLKFGFNISIIVTSFDQDDSESNYKFKIHVVDHPSGTSLINKVSNKMRFKRAIDRIVSHEKPDYIHCNDNTIFYVGKWVNKIKIVYDAHELLPELEYGVRKSITTFLERRKIRHVHAVIIPQIDRLNYFYFRNKDIIEKDKIHLLENFPSKNTTIIPNYFSTKYNISTENIKVLSYVGLISKARRILEIIEAVAKIDELMVFIIGPADTEYKKQVINLIQVKGIKDRVFIKDPIPNEEVISVAASSDIGISFYTDPNLNSYFCASNKLYENLNCGMAVLTNNIAGTARIIQSGINGFLIDNVSVEDIYRGLKVLYEMDSPEKTDFYWENQEEILRQIYS